jgi:asparagine synthase (glutamine-hydrolysing)
MCGIAGILRLNTDAPVDGQHLAHMASALSHRGPDDEGFWLAPTGACGLGAKRLAIIDLAGGHQPLSNGDGSCWAVQNGEIYNYKALRAELETRQHVFRTDSDTEVIVHAYQEWGEGCVERLWGMFALAVWDENRQRLLLARDRFGVKPLYIAQAGGWLLFASEMKALLRHPALATPTLDARSLEDMFTVGFVPGPATIWREIAKLPPAHRLLAEAGSGAIQTRRYWDAPFAAAGQEQPIDTGEATEAVWALLRDAVRLRLQSDVPVGALLSGGLDSSAIVALMQELSGGRAHTFSIGFAASSHDESQHALAAARYLGTEHHVLRFDWPAFDWLPQVVASLDQPQCFATAVPIWLLYRACHDAGCKVILTGEGSDELFAGYHWLRGNQQAEALLALPAALRRLLFGTRLPWPMSPAAQRVLHGDAPTPVARYLAWLQVSSAAQTAALFTPELRAQSAASDRPPLLARWQAAYDPAVRPLAVLHRDLTLERQTRLPDFINHEVDAVSMAHSVEARVPFLDHRLWELLARWGPGLKSDLRRPEKWLLRQVLAHEDANGRPYLPPSLRQRRKQGLAAPHAAWWRRPAMPDWVEDLVTPAALRRDGLFDADVVARWRLEHAEGRANLAPLLTGVLQTTLWLRG